nr:hypothetical protein [uncultured Flavobacterium sp.]
MKKLALILGVLAFSGGVFAQEGKNVKQNDLTGPAYKNYQVWMDKLEPTKIYSQNSIEALEGPAYKNQQPSKNTPKENLVEVKIGGSEKQKLTGPAYKNYGPWTKGYK